MPEGPDDKPQSAATPQPAPGAWVLAFGVCLIILILVLLYLLFRFWPGRLPFKVGEEHDLVNPIPGHWMPDSWVEACYLVLDAHAPL